MTYQIKTNRALCSGLGDDKISIVLDAEAGDDETVLDGPPRNEERRPMGGARELSRCSGGLVMEICQLCNPRDDVLRHHYLLPIRPDAELQAPADELVLGSPVPLVNPHVQHPDAALIFGVEAAHESFPAVRFQHDRDAVQLVVAGMKDVTHTAAAKCRSKAAVRSAAIAWGERPSI